MKIELTNCDVTATYEYAGYDDVKVYSLHIDIPLPGGKAHYTFPITSEQYNSLQYAKALSEKK